MKSDDRKALDLVDRGVVGLAYAYALDAVGEIERTDIEARVTAAQPATRAEFARAVGEVRETMARAASAATTPPPARLRPSIMDALEQQAPTTTVTELRPRRAHRLRWRLAAVAAAAAVAAGIAGVTPPLTGRGQETQHVLAAADSKTATTDVTGGGTASITYSHDENAAVVRFDDVPAPGNGTVYQLWLVDGAPRSAGLVTALDIMADNNRTVRNIGHATALAVTVERASGADAPSGDPIASVSLS